MQTDTLVKTVKQYNRFPVTEEDMNKLCAIAKDYGKVKQYVYDRYGGIRSLGKLYPGYTVQNEMTRCGLRGQLGLPSVYYYLATYDALGDIKAEWTRTKNRVLERIKEHMEFSEDEKHYLRYALKVDRQLDAVLNRRTQVGNLQIPEIPEEFQDLNLHKLDNYLCRQIRRYCKVPETGSCNGFRIAERAYRYGDGGIYISTKENRKRIFLKLTDNNGYDKQLFIKLFPEEMRVEISVPIEVKAVLHPDYINEIGLAIGFHTMFTTSTGRTYGEKMGEMEKQESDRVRELSSRRGKLRAQQKKLEETDSKKAERIGRNNLGSTKYAGMRERYRQQEKAYINREINRLLEEEKPSIVYIPRLPKNISPGYNRQLNNALHMWKRGYVTERLKYKCAIHSIKVVEVIGKDIAKVCAVCGREGKREQDSFICRECGGRESSKVNAARNALKRGYAGMVVY